MGHRRLEKRYFTVEQANAYVPLLEKWFVDIRRLREQIESCQQAIEPVLDRIPCNSGGRAASDFAIALHQFQSLTARIREEGILLRDVDSGLVDFPSRHVDREIYLCWKSGEPRVAYWHELDTGYAGRKSLDELDEEDDSLPSDPDDRNHDI